VDKDGKQGPFSDAVLLINPFPYSIRLPIVNR
jgi:hypothetical protein